MHAVNLTTLEGSVDVLIGDHVDTIDRVSPGWTCEDDHCEFGSWSLTEVAQHVVTNQFIVKPEPLVRTRRETTGARPYRPRYNR